MNNETTSETTMNETPAPKKPRGFAAMTKETRSEYARRGGVAAHKAGTAHKFTSEEGKEAGRKGGSAPHVRRGRGPRVEAPAAEGGES